MDNFTYNYTTVGGELSNRLDDVSDAGADDGGITGDLGDIRSGMSSGNFVYDKIGQLISDASEGIDSLQWRSGDKKLHRIVRDDASSSELEFVYSPFGQRVIKIEKPRSGGSLINPSGSDWVYTYYAYDANGQVMAVYSFTGLIQFNQTVTVDEYNIYGSSREGQLKTSEVVWQNGQPNIGYYGIYQNTVGERNYEVTNHLGNVMAIVNDRTTVIDTTYEAVVLMTSDYYPFGMVMPGRNTSVGESYRYAYNGMEQDNEVSGNGNSYTTEFRQYDPRLGRWKSLDPLMMQFPWMSPYVAFNNNPKFFVDPYGLSSAVYDEPPGDFSGSSGGETYDSHKYQMQAYFGLMNEAVGGNHKKMLDWYQLGKAGRLDENDPAQYKFGIAMKEFSYHAGEMGALEDEYMGRENNPVATVNPFDPPQSIMIFDNNSSDIERLVKSAQAFADANITGATYASSGSENKAKTPHDIRCGIKADCSYFVDIAFEYAGFKKPRTYKGNGTTKPGVVLEDRGSSANSVALVVDKLPIVSYDEIQVGDLVNFRSSRSDHQGPGGKYDHIGIVTGVTVKNGVTTSFTYIHSGGNNAKGTGGPQVGTMDINNQPDWLQLKGAHRPYFEEKSPL